MHTLLISAHATAGVVALVFACVVLRVPRSPRTARFTVYYGATAALLVFMILAVITDWQVLNVTQRVVFSGLIALGAYTFVRAEQARRALHDRPAGWRRRYVDHVGFTAISLFDGFAIIAAIDLGTPPVVVGVVAVFGVIAGIVTINTVKRRMHVPAV